MRYADCIKCKNGYVVEKGKDYYVLNVGLNIFLVNYGAIRKKAKRIEERRKKKNEDNLDSNDVELAYTTAQRRFIGNVRMNKGFSYGYNKTKINYMMGS